MVRRLQVSPNAEPHRQRPSNRLRQQAFQTARGSLSISGSTHRRTSRVNQARVEALTCGLLGPFWPEEVRSVHFNVFIVLTVCGFPSVPRQQGLRDAFRISPRSFAL